MIFLVEESDATTKLTSVILAGLTVFLVMVIIGLLVKVRKLKTGTFSKLLCVSYNWFCCYWTFSSSVDNMEEIYETSCLKNVITAIF